MKPISLALALAAICIFSLTSQAEPSDTLSQEDIMALQESVMNLEESLAEIQSQYQEIYNLLISGNDDNPSQLTNFSSLFQEAPTNIPIAIQGNTITIRDDASIYLGDQKLLDVIKSWTDSSQGETQKSEAEFSSMSGASLMANISYVTQNEFKNLSSEVIRLGSRVEAIEINITTVSTSIEEIKRSQNATEELMTEALGELEIKVNSLQDTIVEGENGGFKSSMSPIENAIPPDCTPSLYSANSVGGYFASSFTMNGYARLKSVTLYCGNPSYLIPYYNVFILSSDLGWAPAYAKSVTVSGNYATYNFAPSSGKPEVNNVLDLRNGRKYYLVIKSTRMYVCDKYRGEGLADMYLMTGSDGSGQKYYPSIMSNNSQKEIWSKFDLGKAELSFDDNGLAISNGGLSVNGSSVITESTLRNAVKTELQSASGAFMGNITYDMFSKNLQNRLITTAGGKITDTLEVSKLLLNGADNWYVGKDGGKGCSLVFVEPNSKINAAGDLSLSSESGNIKMASFTNHECSGQSGNVTVLSGDTSARVSVGGLTEAGIVMLTPRQEIKCSYWCEVTDGSFSVNLSESSSSISFDYFIVHK